MRPVSILFPLTYAAVSVAQAIAVFDIAQSWIGPGWVLAGLLGAAIGGLPVIGTAFGMYSAVEAWGWSWTAAAALFAGPLLAAFAAVFVIWTVTKKTAPY